MTDQSTQNTTEPTDDQTQDANTNNTELEQLKADLEKMTEAAKRAMADLQNVQRRAAQERISLYPTAQADLMIEFLPVIDNFARAFSSTPAELADNEWVKGVNQIEKQFQSILAKVGLVEINPENAAFDPNEHEAMLEVEGPAGQVVQVLEKGYKFGEKVIKPAKVSVGK